MYKFTKILYFYYMENVRYHINMALCYAHLAKYERDAHKAMEYDSRYRSNMEDAMHNLAVAKRIRIRRVYK